MAKVSKGKTVKMVFYGGPFNGRYIHLSDRTCTLPISVNGVTGRYVGDASCLNWEPKGK